MLHLRPLLTSLFLFSVCAPATAELQTKLIEYKHGDVVLEGFLAWDDAVATEEAPQPGIVVCPEWWGNNDYARGRAKKLAELGFVALSIDVYGKGKLTTDAGQASKWAGELYGSAELMRGRAKAGLDVLTSQAQVDKTRLAAIGYCMGGTVALELARTGADLDAVVAFHAGKLTALGEASTNTRIKGAVLACHGQADTFVSVDELRAFHEQMSDAKLYYHFVSYPGAVHAFTNPNAGKFGVPGVDYNESADRRSWEHMKAWFQESFARPERR